MSLTQEQKNILKSTGSVLQEHGRAIMTQFYAALFREQPEYLSYFNQTNQKTGKQPEAFAATIFAFIQNLDNLDAVAPQMSRLSSKHRAVGVKPELYPTLGKYLVPAITDSLGDKATPEVVAAWQALYSAMSSVFIKREKELYAELGCDEADKGFVPFTVVKKDTIATGPTYELTLARHGGGKLWSYTPGQYVTLRIEKDGVRHHGHYTLLEPYNGKTYTVALKQGNDRDQNTIVTEEIVRNRAVGSIVLASAPAGSFGLADGNRHLFISGGIGIASLLPMINELNQQGKASSATVIQCVRTENNAAFAGKLHNTLSPGQYTILTEKDPISRKHLQGKLQGDTQVYISGSELFLGMVENAIAAAGGHPRSQIHVKSIEPTLGLLKAINQK